MIGRASQRYMRGLGVALAVAVATAAEAAVWVSHGPEGGRITGLAVAPTVPPTVYVATAGGAVFRSTNDGASWSISSTGLLGWETLSASLTGTTPLVVDPTTPTTIYVAAYIGVYKTTDGGLTWSATGLSASVTRLVISPTNPAILYAGRFSGEVLKSIDAGANWSTVLTVPGTPVQALEVDPQDANTVYAGTIFTGGMYKTVDGGMNWDTINNGLPFQHDVWELAIDPVDPNTIYAGVFCCIGIGANGVYKSTDGGLNWSPMNTGLTDLSITELIVDPTNPAVLYASSTSPFGNTVGVFKTTNGAASWSGVSTGLSTHRVGVLAIDPTNPATVYAGSQFGGVFRTTTGGGSWGATNSGLFAHTLVSLAIDPSTPATLYTGNSTAQNAVFKTTTGGTSWSLATAGLDHPVDDLVVDPVTSTTVYAAARTSIVYNSTEVYKSTDSGANWNPTGAGGESLTRMRLAIDPVSPSTLYTTMGDSVMGGTVLKTTTGGMSWTPANTGLPMMTFLYSIAIDPTAPSTLYVGTQSQGVYKTVDGAAHWAPANTGLPSNVVGALAVAASNPMTIYAATNGAGVYKTTNGAASWSPVNSGLTNLTVLSLAVDPFDAATVYAGTNGGGVFLTTDGGLNWGPLSTGLANYQVEALAIDPTATDRVYAATLTGVFVLQDCGNGMLDAGEQCDDGNTVDGDCCSSSCLHESSQVVCRPALTVCGAPESCSGSGPACPPDLLQPDGTSCVDPRACVVNGQCQAGVCSGAAGCDDAHLCTQDVCGPSGCAYLPIAATGCRTAAKSLLLLREDNGVAEKLVWKWVKGAATTPSELGDPSATADYALCVYAGTSSLLLEAEVGAGPGWAALGSRGFKYFDSSATQQGIYKVLLRSGAAGQAKVLVKGKGANLPDPNLGAVQAPVIAQVVNSSTAACFETTYSSGDVLRNDPDMFKARTP